MRRSPFPYILTCLLGLCSLSSAADPAWWTSRAVLNTSPARNLSPATIGQAKHVVAQALAELQPPRLPAGEFSTLQADVALIVDLAFPVTPDDFEKQRSVLLIGQLKAMSKPFYDRLQSLDPAWMNLWMYRADILVPNPAVPYSYSPYPWSVSTGDDKNKAVATVGQLKAVFSLALESWVTPDALNPALPTGATDTDGDGISDVTELAIGTSPYLADTDSDGYTDGRDFFPLDSTRWNHPGGSSGDLTGPVITLLEPAGAVAIP